MSRILVVCYSRTGHTRQVAGELARVLGADLEEIVDPTPRSGLRGYLRSGREAYFRRRPPIAPPVHKAADYDLVVVGTPIWNASLSAPVRSYLERERNEFRSVAFFCTCGGMGMDRVFRQMKDAAGRAPVAQLVVRESVLGQPALSQLVNRFATEVRSAMPVVPAAKTA